MKARVLDCWPLLAISALACGGRGDDPGTPGAGVAERPATIVFLGTSLTSGYGVDPEQAFPALIQGRLAAEGFPHRVVNAGVSGETSGGALRRLDWLLRQPFGILVLETGANDMLHGGDPDSTRANIQAILDGIRREKPAARIVLVGTRPPKLGFLYGRGFQSMYGELAERNGVSFVPSLLQGVAGDPDLNLADGIHPNAAGHVRLAENVWRVLRDEL